MSSNVDIKCSLEESIHNMFVTNYNSMLWNMSVNFQTPKYTEYDKETWLMNETREGCSYQNIFFDKLFVIFLQFVMGLSAMCSVF